MTRALVGYTGFIGSNLKTQIEFDKVYNTTNIVDIINEEFDDLYLAGLPGSKWKANNNPDSDNESIEKLMNILRHVKSKKVYYVSTIDVYSKPINVDEDTNTSNNHHAYGTNRSIFEKFVLENFENARSFRLPIVFGKGFKKNYLFDLINKVNLHNVFLDNTVQFYDVRDLASDMIHMSSICNEKIFNLATEPVSLREVTARYFEDLIHLCVNDKNFCTDMRTKHTDSGYIRSKEQILCKIGNFLK